MNSLNHLDFIYQPLCGKIVVMAKKERNSRSLGYTGCEETSEIKNFFLNFREKGYLFKSKTEFVFFLFSKFF